MLEQIKALVPQIAKIPAYEIIVPAVLAVLALIVAFNGRKLIHALKFLVCAGAGFYAGYAIIFPYAKDYLTFLPVEYAPLIVGGVVALVAALLCKFVYVLVFAGAFGYAAYLVLPGVVAVLAANPTYLIVAAVAVAIVALIFRGALEMVGTAFGGAYALFLCLNDLSKGILASVGPQYAGGFNNITPIVGNFTFYQIVCVAVLVIFGLIGLINQIKRRNRF